VKIWDTLSGFCTVTFGGEDADGRGIGHTAGVTAVTFTQNGNTVVSASRDGTVRAFDMKRSVIFLMKYKIVSNINSHLQYW